jgi:hypothetical protein
MAIKSIAALKARFVTAAKPLQQDFHDWLDSFWHKGEPLPATSVDGLPAMLDGKISKQTVAEQVGGFWVTSGKLATTYYVGSPVDVNVAGAFYYRADLGRFRMSNNSGTYTVASVEELSGYVAKDSGYGIAAVTAYPVYAPAFRVSQNQAAGTGHVQEWVQNGLPALSLVGADTDVYGGAMANYISTGVVYRGYMLGVGLESNGSFGCNAVKGAMVFHTDNTSMRFSITGKPWNYNGGLNVDLTASAGIQVDSTDRVYFRGTANAAAAAGDYLLSIDSTTGKAAKTRSVSTAYTPTGSADPAGEVGQITYDNNFMYIRLATGWQRTALNTF